MKLKYLEDSAVQDLIAERLRVLLSRQPVVWIVSGGSNIVYETKVMQILSSNANINRLTVLLADERFGPIGHADSNWQQLQEAGLFVEGPTYIAPYTKDETTIEAAQTRYDKELKNILESGSYVYAQLGMGDDGHVAGILPRSIAAHSIGTMAVGYESSSYTRLTATFDFLREINEIVLVAYGEKKWPQLKRLSEEVSVAEQPVQVLKDMRRVTVYTDYSAS